ncbi:MAG: bacillithiol system redox-active protein YtxJ [Sphingobacteriales bacterium]|nr:bacillithiol system redox-active protein YtxJ [Sphingobacteriales bacterium]MBI3719279.1 bacillithiol system redox-active protein YtxJ [Sphingobacteriales bacterium]
MWKNLQDDLQLESIIIASENKPQVIFKHSTRCGTSSLAKSRIERNFNETNIDFYLIDLIKHRNLSNKIAETFRVYHESPQVLLIKKGECIYEESHLGINLDEIIEQAAINN